MKQARAYLKTNNKAIMFLIIALVALATLFLYKLGSLMGGLSTNEIVASNRAVGWRGIFVDPLYLPLKLVQSVVFFIAADHGQTLTRLPNIVFGVIAVISFTGLIKLWHGTRTALFAGLLFATSAWTLHASRLASFDVLYLCVIPVLLLMYVLLHRYYKNIFVVLTTLAVWGLLLYVPGLVWLLIAIIIVQRKVLVLAWKHHAKTLPRIAICLSGLLWLPLLVYRLASDLTYARTWVGLPDTFGSGTEIIKHFIAVPIHLFVRGPQNPEIWLGQAPILDIFTLTITVTGIYFYAKHWYNSRTQLLLIFATIGTILVGLNGAVGLSLLVPLVYIGAATGLTYLLHEWLKVFPKNKLASGVGVGIITIAVFFSCVYNTRAYFVAWPNNTETKATFQYRL